MSAPLDQTLKEALDAAGIDESQLQSLAACGFIVVSLEAVDRVIKLDGRIAEIERDAAETRESIRRGARRSLERFRL